MNCNYKEDKAVKYESAQVLKGIVVNMEKVLSNSDKIRKAEEIYYRRKMGIPNVKLSKIEGEKKSYLGSKILLQVLVIINLSIVIMAVQNKDYIFTESFLSDIQKYNVNLTQNIKDFIGISFSENVESEGKNTDVENIQEVEKSTQSETTITEQPSEEIVPNEEQTSSINQMDETIIKINELVTFQNPIKEGTVTSRFGTRESSNKNVAGYHTGIDIGAVKRNFNLCSNFSGKLR